MINFQLMSDIHIEYKNDDVPNPLDYITPSSDILILAGDIGSLYKYKQLNEFLKKLAALFKVVIYVPGNQEYYRPNDTYESIPFQTLKARFNEIKLNIPNLHILDKSSIQINDLLIIGCTLWSDAMINIPKFIVKIQEMNYTSYRKLYNEDLSYIKKMLSYCAVNNLKSLVISHHLPSYSLVPRNKLNWKFISMYASNIDYLFDDYHIDVWIAGHIHKNFNTKIKNTRVMSNQMGKPKDNVSDYRRDFTFTV